MEGIIRRLTTQKIPLVLRSRDSFNAEGFRIKRTLTKDKGFISLAVIISKKVDKRATTRNRIRRIFKAAMLNLYNNGVIQDGEYAILISDGSLANLKTDDIEKKIEEVLP
jgi:ribonuclease P protein component